MRDAIDLGFQMMNKLKCAESQNQFKFVHIILTDGEDNESKTSETELRLKMSLLSMILPPEFV